MKPLTTTDDAREDDDRSTWTFRRGLAVLTLVSALALSGCAALPFVGPSCGPGETDIGAIDQEVSDVQIKGEVTRINQSAMVLDDGTGQARLALTQDVTTQVSAGDCVIARGTAAPASDGSAEAVMIPVELYKEEVVVEDS